jgi:hypothetical protein
MYCCVSYVTGQIASRDFGTKWTSKGTRRPAPSSNSYRTSRPLQIVYPATQAQPNRVRMLIERIAEALSC